MDSVDRWLAQEAFWLANHPSRNEGTPRTGWPGGSERFDTLPSRDARRPGR